MRDLEPESLRRFVAYSEDDWFNASLVEETSVRIIDALGNRGFAFVEVDPQVDKDEENRIVNLTFEVNEGPKVFVERIDIEGNFRTLDEVVRREFRLVEGDAFNVTKLRRSRSRIQNLGFFSAVDLQDEPGSQPDRAVVKVYRGRAVDRQPQFRHRHLLGGGADRQYRDPGTQPSRPRTGSTRQLACRGLGNPSAGRLYRALLPGSRRLGWFRPLQNISRS